MANDIQNVIVYKLGGTGVICPTELCRTSEAYQMSSELELRGMTAGDLFSDFDANATERQTLS